MEMANCLMIINLQKGFINDNVKDVPQKVIELTENHPYFDHIISTQYRNLNQGTFCKLRDWHGMIDGKDKSLYDGILDICEDSFTIYDYTVFQDLVKQFLRENMVLQLYIVGIDTDGFVLKTVSDCLQLRMESYVIEDCCASRDGVDYHFAGLNIIKKLIGEDHVLQSDNASIEKSMKINDKKAQSFRRV